MPQPTVHKHVMITGIFHATISLYSEQCLRMSFIIVVIFIFYLLVESEANLDLIIGEKWNEFSQNNTELIDSKFCFKHD